MIERIDNLSIYPIYVIEDDNLKACGGCAAMTITEQIEVEAFESEFSITLNIGDKFILLHPEIKETPEDQFKAVILHEEGHLFLGHMETSTTNELAADAYAVARIGKPAMKAALNSMFVNCCKLWGCASIEEVLAGNEKAIYEVNARFAALS